MKLLGKWKKVEGQNGRLYWSIKFLVKMKKAPFIST